MITGQGRHLACPALFYAMPGLRGNYLVRQGNTDPEGNAAGEGNAAREEYVDIKDSVD
jgi:hypothetical protein